MDKEKGKNEPANIRQGGFIWLWIISHIAFWMTMWLPYYLRGEYRLWNENDSFSLVLILFTALIMALLQSRVTQRVLKQSMRGWVLASLGGALISVAAFSTLPIPGVYPSILVLLLSIAFSQTFYLSRQVKNAWLWFVASVVGILFFLFPLTHFKDWFTLTPWVMGLAISQGIIQAVVMRYLWLNTGNTEKDKPQRLSAEGADDLGAIRRLSLDEGTELGIDPEASMAVTGLKNTI